jgi:hypothetical protein|tara:strand:+ start:222 stop:395 length:174 start_codon:yes stop_codon:yes gene_type:complete
MSYRLFKLTLEMHHFDTFEKDHIVKKKYQAYLEEHKKKAGILKSPHNTIYSSSTSYL